MTASVLCVDPDPDLCAILSRSLSEEGYAVDAVHDGKAGLEALQRGAVDLALIEVQLPLRDGFELVEQIRKLPSPASEIPVFLLTATRITAAYKERARQARATAMLKKPVPLARLHELVAKHLKSAPVPVRRPAPVEVDEDIALQGELRDLDFPSLLHQLHGLRATGALVLKSGRKRKVVQVREGYPVAVKSNLIGECLGNVLVQRGVIAQKDYDESLVRMKKGEGLQGQILVAMQVLDEDGVAQALLHQAEEKLLEIFEWKRGSYAFRPGGRLKGGLALPEGRSPAAWVLAGVRARLAIDRIDRLLHRRADRFIVRADSAFFRLQDVGLSEVERNLVEGLDGQQRIGSFARSEETVRRALYGLLVTGMIAERDTGGESAASVSACEDADSERGVRTELAAMAERLRRQSYFEMLGVSEGASEEQIEQGYERMARRAHPDRFQTSSAAVRAIADEVFSRLETAYETLSDPRRCGEYRLELRKGERRAEREREERRAIDAEVEFQRGESLLRQRHYEAALLCFGNALERASEQGEYHAHYGWCLYLCHPDESAMVEEAIEHVRRGLKLARDHEKPYLFLGRLYKAIGRSAAAEKMFTRAVQIRPDSVEALRELRLINMRRRKKGLIGRILRR